MLHLLLHLSAVAHELLGRRELAQAVAHHLLETNTSHVLLAVMDSEGEAHEFRRYVAGTGPTS